MNRLPKPLSISILALSLCVPSLRAGEPPPLADPIPKRLASASILWENDSLGGTDKHYTNGTRIEFTLGSTIDRESTFLSPLFNFFEDHEEIYGTVFLGQNLYTPRDITVTELIEDDRPYAGWLYAGVRFGTVNEWDDDQRFWFIKRALDYTSLEVNLGVVGPWALGDEVQSGFHELINGQEPMGWDNQINNEIVFDANLFQSLSFRVLEDSAQRVSLDFEPFYNLRAGMVQVYGGGGIAAVLGLNHKLGATPRRLSYSGPLSRTGMGADWEVALFGSMEGRGVAWNTFLDGNVFANGSHTVDKEHFIWHSEVGIMLRYRWLVASSIQVFRSEEFDGQEGIHEFGSGRVGVEFPF
ncbi:MAG: lipid A deacylase LpxR family protein [Verrucomicrobiota bacterium]